LVHGKDLLIYATMRTSFMEIAIGAWQGLAYLRSNENIIHGNLTSSNTLLDAIMNDKIADFGSSRLMTTAANSNVVATRDGCLVFTAIPQRVTDFVQLQK